MCVCVCVCVYVCVCVSVCVCMYGCMCVCMMYIHPTSFYHVCTCNSVICNYYSFIVCFVYTTSYEFKVLVFCVDRNEVIQTVLY